MIQSGTIHLGSYGSKMEGWILNVPVPPEELIPGENRSFRTPDIQFPAPFASAPAPLGALSQAWVSAEASLPFGWEIGGLWRFGDEWVALSEGPTFDGYLSGSGR